MPAQQCLNWRAEGVQPRKAQPKLTPSRKKVANTTVWIYVDASKRVGDLDHLKVFIDEAMADTWLAENDPEGLAFEVLE
jgi:hypothetical protein